MIYWHYPPHTRECLSSADNAFSSAVNKETWIPWENLQRNFGDGFCLDKWVPSTVHSSCCRQSKPWFGFLHQPYLSSMPSLHQARTLPCPGGDEGTGEMQREVLAAGDKKLEAEGWCPWFPLPGAQLAGESIARAISCPAQPKEDYGFINLMSSPPQLIQFQYCRNNFSLLPEEEQTSEARGALPSPPCSQWAAIPKAARRFAKSLILSNSYSQGCRKSSSRKKTTSYYYHQTLQNPRAT